MAENIDANIKQEKNFDVNLHGVRWTMIACATLVIATSTVDTRNTLREIKDVRTEQLKVQQKQLEIAKQQYVLDSLRFYNQNQK